MCGQIVHTRKMGSLAEMLEDGVSTHFLAVGLDCFCKLVPGKVYRTSLHISYDSM
jgi:hypothetical protein